MTFIHGMFSRKSSLGNATVVLLLSLGLGATALLYTALDRLLLHPLNFEQPQDLVRFMEQRPPVAAWDVFPYSDYLTVRGMRSFKEIAVEGSFDTAITSPSTSQPAFAGMVSDRYFSVLGVSPLMGRTFSPTDGQSSSEVPVVLSFRLWQQKFAGSSSAIGSTLFLQGKPFIVIGIMPRGFFGTKLDASPDLWLPLTAQPLLSKTALTDPEPDRDFSILARLRNGVTLVQAREEFAGIYQTIKKAHGENDPQRRGLIVPIADGSFALRAQFAQALKLLIGGLAALLVMICASIAALLLARAARQQRDIAVRIALGARPAGLLARALGESAFLGLIGSLGGLCVAYLSAPLLARLLPAGKTPLPVSLVPGTKIAMAVLVLAMAISLIFGIIPAWLSVRIDTQQVLRKGTATARTGIFSRVLLVIQTGTTLVLLVGTGLLLHTFYVLRHTSPGFDVDHLVCFTLDMDLNGPSAKLPPSFPELLRERIQALPGVDSASITSAELMQRLGYKTWVALTGQEISSKVYLNTSLNYVSSSFFQTLGIPLLNGRIFTNADAIRSPAPTLINQAFAQMFFPNQDPLGKTFGTGAPGQTAKATNIVVGVVGDSKYRSLREALLPIFYAPFKSSDGASRIFFYVRTDGPPSSIIQGTRSILFSLEPQVPFSDVVTVREQVNESLWQERLLSVLAIIFSVVAVLMAGAGLYGLLAYDTSNRTREFGIRMAVGAQPRDVGALVFRELLKVIMPGIILGLCACLLFIQIIRSTLYGVKPFDPASFACAFVMIALIGVIAICQPLYRAMHVDPAIVLRDE